MRAVLLAAAVCLALAGCKDHKRAAPSVDAAQAFMAENAGKPGVRSLPSGVQYEVVRSGPATGPHPKKDDLVKVHYEGKLTTGEIFDSSYERGAPAVMELDGLIPAWIEALQLMRPGDEWRLYVPPAQGYGEDGRGPIPPNAVMIFRIELIDVLPVSRTG